MADSRPLAAEVIPATPRTASAQSRRIRFALDESRDFHRVGHLQLRLKKADARRQTFTLTLQMDNKRLELRNRSVSEPIRLQSVGGRQNEILVQRVDPDHVEGYIRVQGM